MTDQHLGESLRRLPEAAAGEGFTAAVLARVDRLQAPESHAAPERRHGAAPAPRRAGWALAGALTAAATVAAATVAVLLALGAADPRPQDGPVLQAGAPPAGDGETGPSAENPAARGGLRAAAVAGPAGTGRNEGPREIGSGGADPAARAAVANGQQAAPGPERVADADAAPDSDAAAPRRQPAARGTAAPPPASEPSYQLAAAGLAPTGTGADPAERLAHLRRERERLLGELTALRQAVPAQRPAEVLLGGDESFELVLDLQADGRDALGAPAGAYQPASLERRPPAPNRL